MINKQVSLFWGFIRVLFQFGGGIGGVPLDNRWD